MVFITFAALPLCAAVFSLSSLLSGSAFPLYMSAIFMERRVPRRVGEDLRAAGMTEILPVAWVLGMTGKPCFLLN